MHATIWREGGLISRWNQNPKHNFFWGECMRGSVLGNKGWGTWKCKKLGTGTDDWIPVCSTTIWNPNIHTAIEVWNINLCFTHKTSFGRQSSLDEFWCVTLNLSLYTWLEGSWPIERNATLRVKRWNWKVNCQMVTLSIDENCAMTLPCFKFERMARDGRNYRTMPLYQDFKVLNFTSRNITGIIIQQDHGSSLKAIT